jgi:hypothetical protein
MAAIRNQQSIATQYHFIQHSKPVACRLLDVKIRSAFYLARHEIICPKAAVAGGAATAADLPGRRSVKKHE